MTADQLRRDLKTARAMLDKCVHDLELGRPDKAARRMGTAGSALSATAQAYREQTIHGEGSGEPVGAARPLGGGR